MAISKSRVASSANIKTKKNNVKEDNGNILLARGLSARYLGANIPLGPLTSDEMERDLRHMEAFSNACIAYAQQYFIYRNSATLEDNGKKAPQMMVAMPVRIDPEEEKRLVNLRLKIQQCEAQREVLESQYLSLRAHYVHMSQRLKNRRKAVNGRVEFLQELVKKRGELVALQRARLQISREVLACLHYRQSGGKPQGDDQQGEPADLVELWNKIDEQFKHAEDACRQDGVQQWQALKVPKVPPGVPLLLSQLAKPPAFAAAWSTAGMFGSKPESLCWLETEFPEPAHRTKSLAALREEVDFLKRELEKEQTMNRDLQSGIIARRKANVELVAMMALLRTETEAVIARHNILLESDLAKDAAIKIQRQEDQGISPSRDMMMDREEENEEETEEERPTAATATAPTLTPAVVEPALEEGKKTATEDEENDGDDEGELEEEDEEDEGEIVEGDGQQKRSHDNVEGSSRTKRRKV